MFEETINTYQKEFRDRDRTIGFQEKTTKLETSQGEPNDNSKTTKKGKTPTNQPGSRWIKGKLPYSTNLIQNFSPKKKNRETQEPAMSKQLKKVNTCTLQRTMHSNQSKTLESCGFQLVQLVKSLVINQGT